MPLYLVNTLPSCFSFDCVLRSHAKHTLHIALSSTFTPTGALAYQVYRGLIVMDGLAQALERKEPDLGKTTRVECTTTVEADEPLTIEVSTVVLQTSAHYLIIHMI